MTGAKWPGLLHHKVELARDVQFVAKLAQPKVSLNSVYEGFQFLAKLAQSKVEVSFHLVRTREVDLYLSLVCLLLGIALDTFGLVL